MVLELVHEICSHGDVALGYQVQARKVGKSPTSYLALSYIWRISRITMSAVAQRVRETQRVVVVISTESA